ncbi:heavy-metal-associated domain-containing protein [Lactococcus allomyrinae]|uniref:Copper chaperone n=1 Tax=Lactococcus allomyrinae TaxID=2419773 RepID=A0A387BMK3_9LACT|nr:heavy-metal-associated domain-containing protein [Lactococcus allomyrinae]AYF99760.1 copper chaperone [Lactococcus allomyrinae]
MNKMIMKLDELSCPSCMTKIEGTIAQTAGVKTVKVLFNASKVKTEFDENIVSRSELVSKVERLGYEVQNTKVTPL